VELLALTTIHDLVDAWRHRTGGDTTDITHWSPAVSSGARLDRWYVSAPFLDDPWQASSTIADAAPVRTDHLPVILSVLVPGGQPPRGPGPWRLSTACLGLPPVQVAIKATILAALARVPPLPTPPDWDRRVWLQLKADMRRTAYEASIAHSRQQRLSLATAFSSARRARHRLTRPHSSPHDSLAAARMWREATSSATGLGESKAALHGLTADALDQCFGASSSKWFNRFAALHFGRRPGSCGQPLHP
jgi:hypothetical protein